MVDKGKNIEDIKKKEYVKNVSTDEVVHNERLIGRFQSEMDDYENASII